MKCVIAVNTNILIQDARDLPTQKAMAKSYACLIRWKENLEQTDIKKVNQAIIDRWSVRGLQRVKDLAWKIAANPKSL